MVGRGLSLRRVHFDVGERRLLRGAEPVRLSPKAHEVLAALVRQQGRLVTKDELLARVWPDAFVEEAILTVHISALRKALGKDKGAQGYIETVSRLGYRFVTPVNNDSLDEDKARATRGSRPVELYELVGRGRSHLLSASYFEMADAVSCFRAAVEIDRTYALAYAGLAQALCAHAGTRAIPQLEAYSEAKTSAFRALAMDSECADAQVGTRRGPFPERVGLAWPLSGACAGRSTSTRITARRSSSTGA